MLLVAVIVAVLASAAITAWTLARRGQGLSRDASRFAAARAMTNRWAEDPTSAPQPVLDIARQRTESAPADSTRSDADV